MVGADVLISTVEAAAKRSLEWCRPQSQANAYFRYVMIAGCPEVAPCQNRNLLSLE